MGLLMLAVLTVAVGLFVKWYLGNQKSSQLPRQFSTAKFLKKEDLPKHTTEIHRDVYSTKKVPADIDAIVIGSGIGGLSCAGLLSRAGKRCLVLEQHYIAGGSTHAFEDKGFEFDTGIHYIGNIEKRQKYFDLICEESLKWDRMGDLPWDEGAGCYDELHIGDKIYYLRAGKEKYISELTKHFPEEEETIKKWVDLCIAVSKKDLFFELKIVPKWLSKILGHFIGSNFFKYNSMTALEVAQEMTDNKDLQAALLGQFGDYGKSPSVESFFLHASIANHYLNGGFYPNGGSSVIAKGIVPVIERTGGRVLVKKAVEEILYEGGRVTGVKMENGDEIRAPMVISGCGVFNTYKKLLPEEAVPKGIVEKIDHLGPSCSMVYLFVGLDGTPEELKLRSSNIWRWPDRDYDAMLDRYYADPETAPIPFFAGFPCAKDGTWNERFPGKSNAVILTMTKFEWWEEWLGSPQGKRGAEYDEKKKMYEKRILEECLYKYYPQTKGKVTYTAVGSSLTFNHYIGSQEGEVYGLETHPDRFQVDDWLRPESDVPGLYMTGQDVTTLGVTGAMMAGILTAHSVLGYGSVVDCLSGRNLVEDIWHLDAQNAKLK